MVLSNKHSTDTKIIDKILTVFMCILLLTGTITIVSNPTLPNAFAQTTESTPIQSDSVLEHDPIEIGKLVTWTKIVEIPDADDSLAVEIPSDARNLSIETPVGDITDPLVLPEESVTNIDDMTQYKAPLRQIRDDGVLPKDVKCNEGKVLFFKVANKSPVCIYETSIEKLDNKWIGWYNPSSPHFMRLFDVEYLFQKNNSLDRHVTVVYGIDEQNNDIVYNIREEIKKTTDEFLIYNIIDEHKKIPAKLSAKDIFSRNFGFSIVSNDGLDPVSWSDPRTSIKNVLGTIEDYGMAVGVTCDSNDTISGFTVYEESSFKILDKFEIVNIQYDEQVVIDDYLDNDNYAFNDLFFSSGKTEFIFQDNLIPIEIKEFDCMISPDRPYFVYQISFEIKNE